MGSFKGFFLLTRPFNCLLGFFSVFVGAYVTGTIQPLDRLLWACLSAACIAVASNAVNDYYDLDIDRINKPNRPLPRMLVSPKQAHAFSIVFFVLGIGFGALVHLPALGLAASSSVLLYLYSSHLKRTVVWGNLVVALVSGLSLTYGGLAVGRIREATVVGVLAFLYHWAREMIKDAEDVEGDRALGIQTFPIRHGIQPTLRFAAAVLGLLAAAAFVPYAVGMFNRLYLALILVGMDLFLVYAVRSMFRNPHPKNLGRLAVLMKADMVICLIAVCLGRTA